MQKCPKDLSCILANIQHSPRIPGNIAVIVQLLHNISTAVVTDVDEAKMQVTDLEYLGRTFCFVLGSFGGKGKQVSI